LLIRSRKRLGSLAAIHDRPPWLDNKHEDRSHDVAAAASHFSLSPRLAVTPAVLTVKAVLEVIHIDTMGPQRAHFPMWGARS
jgi:hypothetical protein